MAGTLEEKLRLIRDALEARRSRAAADVASVAEVQECDLQLHRLSSYGDSRNVLCPKCWVESGKKIHMQPVMPLLTGDDDADTDETDEWTCTLCKTTVSFAD